VRPHEACQLSAAGIGRGNRGINTGRDSDTSLALVFDGALDEEYLAEVIPAQEFGGSFAHDAPGRSYGLDVNFKF